GEAAVPLAAGRDEPLDAADIASRMAPPGDRPHGSRLHSGDDARLDRSHGSRSAPTELRRPRNGAAIPGPAAMTERVRASLPPMEATTAPASAAIRMPAAASHHSSPRS